MTSHSRECTRYNGDVGFKNGVACTCGADHKARLFVTAEVTKIGMLDMQVCVPEDWTDEQAESFANRENPAGTTHGWKLRAADDPAQAGAPIRVKCRGRDAHVHIMLTC